MNAMKQPDKIDKKIITMINDDWEQGTTKIGRELKLSHTAIRSRLKRLKRDLIKVNCNVNIEKLGFKLFLLCLDTRVKSEVVDRIKCCPKIISYFNTYGEYNFIMLAAAENIETMESMIEHCFSFNCTDITKYSMIPIINSSSMYQPIKFLPEIENVISKQIAQTANHSKRTCALDVHYMKDTKGYCKSQLPNFFIFKIKDLIFLCLLLQHHWIF